VFMVELLKQGSYKFMIVLWKIKKLHSASQSEQRDWMLTSGAMALHDNVCFHIVAHTWVILKNFFYWELSDHPPYSPDFALTNYHLFTHLKNWLWPKHLNNNKLFIVIVIVYRPPRPVTGIALLFLLLLYWETYS
jgi:hypothetical protein